MIITVVLTRTDSQHSWATIFQQEFFFNQASLDNGGHTIFIKFRQSGRPGEDVGNYG